MMLALSPYSCRAHATVSMLAETFAAKVPTRLFVSEPLKTTLCPLKYGVMFAATLKARPSSVFFASFPAAGRWPANESRRSSTA